MYSKREKELMALERDQTSIILQQWSPFARLSRRLLADILEKSEIFSLSRRPKDDDHIEALSEADQDEGDPRARRVGKILAFVVLNGRLEAPAADLRDFGLGPHLRASIETGTSPLRLQPRQDETARVLLLTLQGIPPEVAWSLDIANIKKTLQKAVRPQRRPELVWLTPAPDCESPVAALAHLLAGTLATDLVERDPEETTAIVTLGPKPQLAEWNPKTRRFAAKAIAKLPHDVDQLCLLVDKPRTHIFFANPVSPRSWPKELDNLKLDRIVYLTDRVPHFMPLPFVDRLDRDLLDPSATDPYYSSFIATVLLSDTPARAKRRSGNDFHACSFGCDDESDDAEVGEHLGRINRDACVVRIDPEKLDRAWRNWEAQGGIAQSTPFHHVAVAAGAVSEESASRWGRAVTNRRVGFALSGGGACAYRAGPVLAQLARENIPIDVFAGLSGGALVGAFYCHSGLAGFARVANLGSFIHLTSPLALATTWPLQSVVDRELGNARVEEQEVRFAAVCVALPADQPPAAKVVVRGTIGEAVRVSGTLPPLFARTRKKGMLYTDGGAGSVVPALVARDFGADVILACNAIPGPGRSSPMPNWARRLVEVAAAPLDRLIDYSTWHSFFFQQISRRFLAQADVSLEFSSKDISLAESGMWTSSWSIIETAKQAKSERNRAVQELAAKWRDLGRRQEEGK